jgi:FHA domain/Protein of unknown function (DUF3662)
MSNSELPEEDDAISDRVEGGVRKFFEKLGGAIDFTLRRPTSPQIKTDVTALVHPLENAIEAKLRHEGSRVIAPNLIELRYDYETYQQLTSKRREFLERELRLSVYEYIHNRRYATRGDVEVKIAYDMFTRKLSIKARFPDETVAADAAAPNTTSLKPAKFAITLRAKAFEIRAESDTRITVGRTHDNALIIENSSVSSVHAAFTSSSANGTVYISDLGSSNGTFVNGVQIVMGEKTIVKSGDRLKLGDVEIQLEIN